MTLTQKIAGFARELSYDDIPEDALTTARYALADALACAVAASREPAGRALREYVLGRSGAEESTLLGTGERVPVPDAALVNSTLVRDLDANDLYAGNPARDTGHFSDAVPAIVAAAERRDVRGRDLLVAIVVAYEVQAALAEAYLWMDRGLHSVSEVAWALPAALGALRPIEPDVIAHAIGMSGTTAGLVLQSWLRPDTRISNIKAVSTGLVAGSAVRAFELAELGLTASLDALETLFERLPSDADPKWIEQLGESFATPRTMMKRWPAQIYLQAAIQAALEARGRLDISAEVGEVVVEGHAGLAGAVQGSAEAYRPLTRASADHSAPFAVAAALRDGDLTPETYAGEPWRDRSMLDLMDRVRLVVDDGFDAARREHGRLGCRLTVRTTVGDSVEVVVEQQTGHPDKPLADDELRAKLAVFADPVLGTGAGETILDAVERLDSGGSVRDLLAACAPARPGART